MDPVDLALADLARSGISPTDAATAGMYVVDDAKAELDASFKPRPALVIPYPNANGFYRLRYLGDKPRQKALTPQKVQRYAQLPQSGVRAYFPTVPGVDWAAVLSDPKVPVLITEGEKKALAATLAGFPTIGLGGVFNWLENGQFLPELAAADWVGRHTIICFDSDAVAKSQIQAAEARLAAELALVRKAKPRIARLPAPADGSKVGLDDYLVQHGAKALEQVLEHAIDIRAMDRAILALNSDVAWVEEDGMVWDIAAGMWLRKDNFCNGSSYSALHVLAPKADGVGVKRVSVSKEWLISPLARRYARATFSPDEPPEMTTPQGLCYNLWTGYTTRKGDAAPWVRLTEHLMTNLPENLKDFALKLLAYKAQHASEKVPLALVLVGPQGCGKSMWAMCLREAFQPYGLAISSKALLSEFNPWVERSIIAVIDEAQSLHLTKGADTLKGLISERRTQMRDLYRSPRQVESYTMYILTSNDRKVGAYASDDRRMFVIDTPPPADPQLYADTMTWLNAGGGPQLMQYLLDYDLQGWTPPARAPMTAEKYMAYMESLTPIQRLAEEMRTASANTVKLWLDSAMEWALLAELSAPTAAKAREIKDAVARIQVRPFYTPEELSLMFPSMATSLYGTDKAVSFTPGEMSRQLRECGVSYLRSADDPRGFQRHGRLQQYLVIAEPDRWTTPLTQAEFDTQMAAFPFYKDV